MLSLKLLLPWSPLELGDVYMAQGLNLVQEQTNSFTPGAKQLLIVWIGELLGVFIDCRMKCATKWYNLHFNIYCSLGRMLVDLLFI